MVQGKDPNEGYQPDTVEEEEIPIPTYDNLGLIADELSSNFDMNRKRKISQLVIQDNVSSHNF